MRAHVSHAAIIENKRLLTHLYRRTAARPQADLATFDADRNDEKSCADPPSNDSIESCGIKHAITQNRI